MKTQFLTPVVTVFQDDGKTPDWEGNRKVHDFLIRSGVDGLVLMGSTGEFFSMTLDTQKAFVDFLSQTVKGRTRVFIGASRMLIDETIELCNYAVSKGLNEVMLVSPYYFKLPEEALETYYDKIADSTDARIYLYNFPDRTGHDLNPELVLRLAKKHSNICGIKDTVSNMGHTSDIMSLVLPVRPDFEIFSGFDDNLVHNAMGGGAGCIGGLSNLIPEVCAAWVAAIRRNDVEEMVRYQAYINDAMAIYKVCTPFMPAIKYAMNLRGLEINETCSAPILKASETQKAQIRALLERLEIRPV